MAGDTDPLAALRGAALFAALDDAALGEVLARGRTRRVKAGELVFLTGQPADRFFAILEGRVKVYKLSPRSEQQLLHLYGPGDTFGEAAVWSGGDYPAAAEAGEDARLLEITRRQLAEAFEANVELAFGMMAGLSAKLREFAELIERLSLQDVPGRVAAELLAMARAAGGSTFRLPMAKRDLAARLGTTPETLSRTLAKLSAAGLVQVRGREIRVLKPDALRDLT